MSKPSGLGRGLDALFVENEVTQSQNEITVLRISRIEPDKDQHRKSFDPASLEELAQSISTHGLIQPIIVRPLENGNYKIIAGERRWRAARLAGLTEIPVNLVEADDRTVMELALVENLQRRDLNPMEEAEGYRTLMEDYGLTQEEAAERVGKSRPAVANALRLLSLPDEVRKLVVDGTLSAGHARAVLSIPDERRQRAAAQRIIALRLSVRQAEAMCKRMAAEEEEADEPKVAPPVNYVGECEKHLTRRLGRRVKIVCGKRKGRFELEFYDQDDLQRLYEALQQLNISEERND